MALQAPRFTENPGLSAPRQKRSRRTLEALTRAATELLEERPFSAITVQDVVARAGSSVGSFYARFADKEALLIHLHQAYQAEVNRGIDVLFGPARLACLGLEEIVHRAVRAFAAMHTQRPGAMRAFHARAALDPEFRAREEAMNALIGERFIAALIVHRDRIGHPHPREAIDFAAVSLLGALLQRVFFAGPGACKLDDHEFSEHLEHAFLAHLCVRDGRTS